MLSHCQPFAIYPLSLKGPQEPVMPFFTLWFLCGIAAGLVGASKGEGILGFIVGFVLGPIGLIGAILSTGNKRRCTACRTYIDPKATLCPNCRTAVAPRPSIWDHNN